MSPNIFAPVSGSTSYCPFSPMGKDSTSVGMSTLRCFKFISLIISSSTKVTLTSHAPVSFSSVIAALQHLLINMRVPVGTFTFFCSSVICTFTLSTLSPPFIIFLIRFNYILHKSVPYNILVRQSYYRDIIYIFQYLYYLYKP